MLVHSNGDVQIAHVALEDIPNILTLMIIELYGVGDRVWSPEGFASVSVGENINDTHEISLATKSTKEDKSWDEDALMLQWLVDQ